MPVEADADPEKGHTGAVPRLDSEHIEEARLQGAKTTAEKKVHLKKTICALMIPEEKLTAGYLARPMGEPITPPDSIDQLLSDSFGDQLHVNDDESTTSLDDHSDGGDDEETLEESISPGKEEYATTSQSSPPIPASASIAIPIPTPATVPDGTPDGHFPRDGVERLGSNTDLPPPTPGLCAPSVPPPHVVPYVHMGMPTSPETYYAPVDAFYPHNGTETYSPGAQAGRGGGLGCDKGLSDWSCDDVDTMPGSYAPPSHAPPPAMASCSYPPMAMYIPYTAYYGSTPPLSPLGSYRPVPPQLMSHPGMSPGGLSMMGVPGPGIFVQPQVPYWDTHPHPQVSTPPPPPQTPAQPQPQPMPQPHHTQEPVLGKALQRLQQHELHNYSASDIIGNVARLSMDNQANRLLHARLSKPGESKFFEIVLRETIENIVIMMTNPTAQSVCQKLCELGSLDQQERLVSAVAQEMRAIAFSMYGTRGLQRIMNTGDPGMCKILYSAIAPNLVSLSLNPHGNHVVQQCVQRCDTEDVAHLFHVMTANCVLVATHKHGCCVLQRCLEFATERQGEGLVEAITTNCVEIAHDQYGNYVVQFVLDLKQPQYMKPIAAKLTKHLVSLSKEKFSSHVLEKALQVAEGGTRNALVMAVVDTMGELLFDCFSNYVVQTALNVANHHQFVKLAEAIQPHMGAISFKPYGKKITNMVHARALRFSIPPFTTAPPSGDKRHGHYYYQRRRRTNSEHGSHTRPSPDSAAARTRTSSERERRDSASFSTTS